ncbi:MAG: SprT-like domain-containing protein [Pyrinomonadaceae bacterium]|nr:SprT-like domain-containing protein [Pyrinomonadaceae bacterium]MCX7639252.1 SprT-like domain-containing protein [Pyrinomonadaceae bacterium]MDW8303526.1 SprT-like domain-containing protein [Acidobacteriota bacterium]
MNAKSTKNVKQQLIQSFYEEALKAFSFKKVSITFYPYKGLRHKIKVKDGYVTVRLASFIENAPLKIHKTLARMLVAKLLKKKVSQKDIATYEEFLEQNRIKLENVVEPNPKGQIYNLEEIFENLNKKYFDNKIPKPVIKWSSRKTYRKLGCCSLTGKVITISKILDNEKVPLYVLEYVMYHEILHIKHPASYQNGKRLVHTKEFKKDEKKFKQFEKARRWLDEHQTWLQKQSKI